MDDTFCNSGFDRFTRLLNLVVLFVVIRSVSSRPGGDRRLFPFSRVPLYFGRIKKRASFDGCFSQLGFLHWIS